jgi:muramoyltetrapeptide carboxypeptidase
MARTKKNNTANRYKNNPTAKHTTTARYKSNSILQKGDSVDVIAPGFPTTKEELDQAIRFVESLGLKPIVPKDLFGDDLICSQAKSIRLKHLKTAIYKSPSKAIWCLRGGYGALQMAPEILKWPVPKKNKVLIGYSDVSTLFQIWNQKWNMPTLHGALLDRLGKGDLPPEQVDCLINVLFGKIQKVNYPLIPINLNAKKTKSIKAQIWGGNLTVITSAVGTPTAMKPKGQMIFFEDTGERAYRVDRMICQLEQSGFFKNVKAILLGNFIGGLDKDGQSRVMSVWQKFAQQSKIPVFIGLPAGHGNDQWPVPLGTMAHVTSGREAQIEIQTGLA